MKMRKMVVLTAAVMLTAGMAQAAHLWEDPGTWSSGIFCYDMAAGPKYTANELSLDLFGSYTAAEEKIENIFKTNIKGTRGVWGGGVGLNYFLTRELGIGADMNMSANGRQFVDQAVGNLILRFPIESIGLAPYIIGGGGRSFDPEGEWLGDVGVGLEWRFNRITGIFSDARYEWVEHSNDRLLLRAGLRFVF